MILKETITREVEFDNKQEIREWSTRMKKIGYSIVFVGELKAIATLINEK